ncbi:hypothetical protein NYE69_28175 [Paenibacillus sp. FSL R5-0527]|uniref:hypothetical protein n=1 Tax=Paenibacillus sp. FSL R5-0527 TaxID=2975321 RepID=UPI000979F2AC|nr:hypothetical protein BK140_11215 [Paenibacillus macerans]
MLERLNNYNWREAFEAAGAPEVVQFAKSVFTAPFNREDVAEIIAISDGKNDGPNWIGVFRLKDGRFGTVDAGCDYTGWDCQQWGSAEVAGSLEEIIRFGLTNEQRERLGLSLPPSMP